MSDTPAPCLVVPESQIMEFDGAAPGASGAAQSRFFSSAASGPEAVGACSCADGSRERANPVDIRRWSPLPTQGKGLVAPEPQLLISDVQVCSISLTTPSGIGM